MQLSFFPVPLPDEALYSIIARYHETMLYESYRDTVEDLFGRPYVSAVCELPSNICALVERLPWDCCSVDNLITKHTAAPYYGLFATESRRAQLRDALAGAPPPSAPAVLGVMANRVKSATFMRYCDQCVEENRTTYGTSFWHRVHQLPGVVVCPEHHSLLTDSCIERSARRTRHAFKSLEHSLGESPPLKRISSVPFSTLAAIAHDSAWMLTQSGRLPEKSLLEAALQARFRLIGWMTASGNLRVKALAKAWEEQYPQKFRQTLGCGIGQLSNPASFARALLFDARNGVHPLLAILLIRLAGLSVESITVDALSIGNSKTHDLPLPRCINPVCPERNTSRWIILQECSQQKDRVVACCTCCGMQFSNHYNLTDTHRVLRRGSIWEETLQELVGDSSISLRQVARTLGVDPTTIKKHAARLGLTASWSPLPEKQKIIPKDVELRDKNRVLWVSLRKEHSYATRSGLRRLAPALWTWLYRNDRKWLVGHQPRRKKIKQKKNRVDWEERDHQLCLDLISATRRLLADDGKPIQITRTELARRVGNAQFLRNIVIKHLPRSARLSQRLAESRCHYAERRISWCVDQYLVEGIIPERWELVRRAGIRSDMEDECNVVINQALTSLGSTW